MIWKNSQTLQGNTCDKFFIYSKDICFPVKFTEYLTTAFLTKQP